MQNDKTRSETKTPRIGRRAVLAGVGATAVTAVAGVGMATSASAGGFHYPKIRPGLVHRDNVGLLKYWLDANGYDPTAGRQIAVYDKPTQRMVQHFQVRCALKTDAIVGPKTWCALIAHKARRQKLRRGMRTADVQILQLALNARFDSGLSADQVFGAATEREVKRYQRMAGLAADGVVGDKTWSNLARGR